MEEILLRILLAGGAAYLLSKCAGWKMSWIGWIMIFAGAIIFKEIQNIWQAIGILCGIGLILSLVAFMQDEAKEKKYEQRLINMLMGDEEAAERLIRYEEARNPDALRSECIAAAIERLQQDQRSWNPGEPVKHWRPEPEQETHWGWGIAGWIIVIAAICLVGSKVWQQHQEEARQARMVQQARIVQQVQMALQARMVQPAPQMQQHQIQTPTQELCWIDGNGRKIYSNTVPQGKGVKPCP